MINTLKLLFIFLLAAFFASGTLCAQSSAPLVQGGESDADGNSEEIINTELVFYRKNFINSYIIPSLVTGDAKAKSKVPRFDNVFWIKSDGKWKSFEVASNATSKKFNYRGSPNFRIYQRVGGDEKSPELKPVSNIVIPKGASEVAILMFVKKTNVKFYPIDFSPQALPKGKIVVMNMTSVPVALQVGTDNKLLRSISHMVFTSKSEGSAIPVKAAIRDTKTRKWIVLYKSRISPDPDLRNLVLLYDPFERKSTNINVQLLNF